jgi:hypothetical protein
MLFVILFILAFQSECFQCHQRFGIVLLAAVAFVFIGRSYNGLSKGMEMAHCIRDLFFVFLT